LARYPNRSEYEGISGRVSSERYSLTLSADLQKTEKGTRHNEVIKNKIKDDEKGIYNKGRYYRSYYR